MKTHIVFDLDGTLANTQIIHQSIESEFLRKYGLIVEPVEIGKKYAGRSPIERIPELLNESGVPFQQSAIDDFIAYKDERVVRLLKESRIDLMPNAKELLETLRDQGYPMGISSGACREFIDAFQSHFELTDTIEASTSADEVVNKKPAPDVFQKSFDALERKYGTPSKKWVVGDGKSDMKGGHALGAMTVLYNDELDIVGIQDIIDYRIHDLLDLLKIIEPSEM